MTVIYQGEASTKKTSIQEHVKNKNVFRKNKKNGKSKVNHVKKWKEEGFWENKNGKFKSKLALKEDVKNNEKNVSRN